MSALRRGLVWGCVRLARLPSLPPPVVDRETEARFAAIADSLLSGEPPAVPEPRLDFLRWLAENRPVPCHDRIRYYRDGEPSWVSLLRA
jgi:hypothetical protein